MKLQLIFRLTVFWTVFFVCSNATGTVKLPALFTDNMVLQREAEVPVWGWSKANQSISLSVSWLDEPVLTHANANGEWKVSICTPVAGGPYTMDIDDGEVKRIKNILIGEVWLLSGQSNMEMPLKGYKSQPVTGGNDAIVRARSQRVRMITVPRNGSLTEEKDFLGNWNLVSPQTVSGFSAIGWFYADYLVNALQVPVGLIQVAYGGSNIQAWMSEKMLKDFSDIAIPRSIEDVKVENRTATVLYNAMLKPLLGYGVKGVLFYQGESNVIDPGNYESLFVKMVASWRKEWGQENLDFYFAQIAPYQYKRYIYDKLVGEANGAYLREAQRKAALRIPRSGMVVLMDVGEPYNIHPPRKKEVAARFAYQALAQTYGLEGFEYRSPELGEISVDGEGLSILFNHVENGLVLRGESENGIFQIAGDDRIFYDATVSVKGNKITCRSANVRKPVALRYAFKNFENAVLFSSSGLPVSSFKTDNWNE